ncbi:hypothetical protein HGA88_01190 [Candidatus Roizmanbacteria bacterium]|nr:hypothetical protein [Candidatus Roizmanbacteria bacterium]
MVPAEIVNIAEAAEFQAPQTTAEENRKTAARQKLTPVFFGANASDIKQLIDENQDAADEAMFELNTHAKAKREGRAQDSDLRVHEGQFGEKGKPKHKYVSTQLVVQEFLKAIVTKGPHFASPVPIDSAGGKVLGRLAEAFSGGNVEQKVGYLESPYIYKLVHKAISGTLDNPLHALSNEELQSLKMIDAGMHYKLVMDVIRPAARDAGISDAEVTAFWNYQMKGEASLVQPLSDKEREVYKDNSIKINNAIKAHLNGITDEAARTTRRDEIDNALSSEPPQWDVLFQYLQGPGLLTEGDLRTFVDLDRRYMRMMAVDEYFVREISGYSIQKSDLDKVSAEKILDEIRNDSLFVIGPDNKPVLNEKIKAEMLGTAYKTINKLLQNVSSNPDMDWQEAYNPLNEGRVTKMIQYRILSLKDNDVILKQITDRWGKDAREVFKDFISTTVVSEIASEVDMRQAYHTAQRFFKRGWGGPEEITKFAKQFPASKLVSAMQVVNPIFMQLVQREFETDLQNRILTEGNTLPANLFASYFDPTERMKTEDYKRLKNAVRQRIETIKNDPGYDPKVKAALDEISDEENDWQFSRALILAPGVSLFTTLRGQEIMAMAYISKHLKGPGSEFAQYFSMAAKWRAGRGGQDTPDAGFRFRELFKVTVKMEEEKSLRKRLFKGWNPIKLLKNMNNFAAESQYNLVDLFTDNLMNASVGKDEATLSTLFRKFNLPGFFSRGGWRLDAFKEWYAEQHQKKTLDANWTESYENIRKEVGAGALWYLDGARAEDEFWQGLWGSDYKTRWTAAEIAAKQADLKKEPPAYFDSSQTDTKDRYVKVHGEKLTITEFLEKKTNVYHGRTMYSILERSPNSFLTNILQLEPKLLDTVKASVDGTVRDISMYEFLFHPPARTNLNQAQQKDRENLRNQLLQHWGEHGMHHIEKITELMHNVYYTGENGQRLNSANTDKKNWNMFFNRMTTETQRVVLKDARSMDEIFTRPGDTDKLGQAYWDMLYGTQGMVTHFRGMFANGRLEEAFAIGKGKELGDEHNFFVKAVENWRTQIGEILPNFNEVKTAPFLDKIASDGEAVFSRLWGDLAAWNKVTDKLCSFDEILHQVAITKDRKPLIELHAAIHEVRGIVGIEQAQKLNYILTSVTSRFFQEHHLARAPFPLNLVYGSYLGRFKSLSSYNIHGGWTWNENDIADYINELTEMHFIGDDFKQERFNDKWLKRNLGADWQKLLIMQYGPNIMTIGMLLLLAEFIRRASSKNKHR